MTMGRAGEIALALGLLVLCAPVLILILLALAMETRSNPLMRDDRCLFSQRPVRLFTLRTERLCVHGRVPTRAGAIACRWHLDKLPMLINILMGEISLTGWNAGPSKHSKRSLRVTR